MRRVSDIDFALDAGFQMTLSEISAEEFHGLQILRAERAKWEAEKPKRGAVPNKDI